MLDELIGIINEAVFVGLLLLGGYLVLMNIRTLLLPQRIGTLVAFGDEKSQSETIHEELFKKPLCGKCSLAETVDGRMSFPVQVRLKDNTTTTAEISPCTLCMDKLRVGDTVGLTEVGSRTIVQKTGRITNLLIS